MKRLFLTRRLAGTVFSGLLGVNALWACSASPEKSSALGASGGSAADGSAARVGTAAQPGVGGGISVGSGGSSGPTGGGDATCVRIGMLGRKPSYGADGGDDTDALQTWLSAHVKAGTTVDVVTTKPTLTSDFLSKYDVIILQALEDTESSPNWTFSASEISSFEAWVRAGGGIVSLMGYGANSQEVVPSNQLLAFTGISYNQDDPYAACNDSVNGQDCCYCTFSSMPAARLECGASDRSEHHRGGGVPRPQHRPG